MHSLARRVDSSASLLSQGAGSSAADDQQGISASREARLQQTVSGYFERFDRYESQELLAYSSAHWMLSSEDHKTSVEPPSGIVSHLQPLAQSYCWLLLPEETGLPADAEPLDFREVHQIVRELTLGIYIMNQTPSICLEANYDLSSTVQLPPAYIDTRVGQLLSNVDYMLKALWHGSCFPRDKRLKFSDRWRKKLDVNQQTGVAESKTPHLMEFRGGGMIDITQDQDYKGIYKDIPVARAGDIDAMEETQFFMSHAEDMSLRMTMLQNSMQQFRNMFVIDADWIVSAVVRVLDEKLDHAGYERLQSRLQMQQKVIKDNLANKAEVKQELGLLKFVSFLVPFLCAMRRKMRIPDVSRLLPPMYGDAVKTEREFPPLMLGPEYSCKNFSCGDSMFHLHGGIQIDLETPNPSPAPASVAIQYEDVIKQAGEANDRALDPDALPQESYEVPLVDINGRRYHAIRLELDTYYPQPPQKPRWVQTMVEQANSLKPKRLPITETQMLDVFKKCFGYQRALKLKNVPASLKVAAVRGLVAVFSALSRKSSMSQLMKQDELGMSLIHLAAVHNRPQVVAILIAKSMDVNSRRNQSVLSVGNRLLDGEEGSKRPTALHLAARCGSLDATACLVGNYANVSVIDQNGWAPIHHAAFYNHEPIIRLLVHKTESQIELPTQNEEKNTPLLLAANSGALAAVKCLIALGANIRRINENGNNIIHLAALRFHTNILEHFIQWNNPAVQVWSILIEMLKANSGLAKQDAAVRCLEVLSTSGSENWLAILKANGIPPLIDLLKSDHEEIQSVAASVLCNMAQYEPVQKALTAAGATATLVQLLDSPLEDVQSRAAIILADVTPVSDNQQAIPRAGGIAPLVRLLESSLEDVLVNAVNALRVLCVGNVANQTEVARSGAVDALIEFLAIDSEILQAAASSAIAALAQGHKENQQTMMKLGAVLPLVELLKSKNVTVQVKAASAVEAIAENNPAGQTAFLESDTPTYLISLLKTWSDPVKEQGACALWALAGETKPQQKYIAERIGVTLIIDMLMRKTEKLQYVGCVTMMALCREDIENQNKMCENRGIEPVVRLVKSTTSSEKVLLTAIQTLGVLCIGVAHQNNPVTQQRIAENNGISILVGLLPDAPTQNIQVEVATALAAVVLSSRANQERLKENPAFSYSILLNLLASRTPDIALLAGNALAIFCFNNPPQQFSIREAGGISYIMLEPFLNSDNEWYQAYSAFQIVVLARVIVGNDQVSLTARGITQLVRLLGSREENIVILCASLLSSLAHTRAGIPDAMVTSGAIEALVSRLTSANKLVRTACAVALAYLTFNKTAARLLLSACRNSLGLYERITENVDKDAKMSEEFTRDFEHAKMVGLPSQSLEINGGPPVCLSHKVKVPRPKTSQSAMQLRSAAVSRSGMARAISAPAKPRAKSALP